MNTKNSSPLQSIYLLLFVLLLTFSATPSFAKTAVAGKSATVSAKTRAVVILDDSAGMCGYLKAGSQYNKMLSDLQILLESSADFSDADLLPLSAVAGTALASGPAIQQIDKVLSSPKCPFNMQTSPLDQLFVKGGDAELALMPTDLLFDQGAGGGLAASRTKFVSEAVRWREKNPAGAMGVIALRSSFDGNYFSVKGNDRKFSLNTQQRAVYLVWFSRTPQANAFVVSLKERLERAQPELTLFQLMPTVSASGTLSFTGTKKASFATLTAQKPDAITYEADRLDHRVDSVNPSSCFRYHNNSLRFVVECSLSKSGVDNNPIPRESRFYNLTQSGVVAVNFWYKIPQGLPLPSGYLVDGPQSKSALVFNILDTCENTLNNASNLAKKIAEAERNASSVAAGEKNTATEAVKSLKTKANSISRLAGFCRNQFPVLAGMSGRFLVIRLSKDVNTWVNGKEPVALSVRPVFNENSDERLMFGRAAKKWNSFEELPCSASDCNDNTVGFADVMDVLSSRLSVSSAGDLASASAQDIKFGILLGEVSVNKK